MRRLLARVSMVVTAIAGACDPGAHASTRTVSAALASALQQRIDLWNRRDTHRGVSASVILADGAQWSGAAGETGSDTALDSRALIQIGSITKTMTAAVVLQLVDEGVLRLEDPIDRWLPARPNIDGAITVRQLLNHTNGLANYTGTGRLSRAIADDPAHVFLPDELLKLVDEPRFARGSATEYTNTSFLLLGQIAARATGRSIVDLYRQRLFAPLELNDIFMPGLEEPPGPVAFAFAGDEAANPLDYPALLSVGHSAFGLLSNAATIARWGRALFSGRVISEARQREMRELVPAAGTIVGETGSGLGIRGYEYLGRRQFGHSGGATFGSSLLLYDPVSGVTVVVIMNQGEGADHFFLAPALLEIALGAS